MSSFRHWCFGVLCFVVVSDLEPQKSVEALPQIAGSRLCSGSIPLASTLQKSSVFLLLGHQSRHSRKNPFEPAPVTQLSHRFCGPKLNGLFAALLFDGT